MSGASNGKKEEGQHERERKKTNKILKGKGKGVKEDQINASERYRRLGRVERT